MDKDEFVAKLFDRFAENFPNLTDVHRQIVADEIETAIHNEWALGDLRFDEGGLARIEFAIAAAFDRLGVSDVDIADRDDEH